MTRVLMHLPSPKGLTGAPRRTLALAEALRANGATVGLLGDPEDAFIAEGARHGFEVIELRHDPALAVSYGALGRQNLATRTRFGWAVLRRNLRIAAAMRRWRADVGWTRSAKGFVLSGPGMRLARRPVIWDVDYEVKARGAARFAHGLALRLSSAVVYQHRAAAAAIFGESAARRYARKSCALVPGLDAGAALEAACAAPPRPAEGPLVFLQCGSVSRRKNQVFSARLFGALLARAPGTRAELWLVGDEHDPEHAAAVRAVAQDGGFADMVRFLGWRDDAVALMAQSDVLLMPSLDEGVPNAVQEAMLLGLPVIASTAGGMPEILDNGRTGWALPLEDESAWADVLARLAAEPGLRAAIGAAAADHARERFTLEAWGRAYAQVVADVAGVAAPPAPARPAAAS